MNDGDKHGRNKRHLSNISMMSLKLDSTDVESSYESDDGNSNECRPS